ncbi:phosphonate metabolism protein/1,5-bisphosphokinase (PRPP-forming) PhnN [Citreicella sp. C3M06]|uniref:phosphonate metabolism protein/1,5-bisphosphokinase (PRPP-forming) PhnN n=1 Tax=Citreicella sp. C3M06 TaxID=2841564 RepID=UPI001C094D8C|nr:phosphonate metabolism protein/1,5-bisphosphokinase (PRPP-forming) PhnN [Citreicella sp. C3M06]MBU2962862.1 phosphonate metabolism protein/1,5-bisphosphokinase (PRPP-forming) PhnN [Citreicella sp. C3M06]
MSGRFVAVIGPSGVGKDTLMVAVAARLPGLGLVRRVITRKADAGGEEFDAVSEDGFARRVAEGAFALHWRAHGLGYGIPVSVLSRVAHGEQVLCNLSRGALLQAAERFPGMAVLHVTARPEVLAARLAARGREDDAQIAARLARAVKPLPEGIEATQIDNSGPLDAAVAAMLHALQPERA